jgi:hypothetical protein
MVCETEVVLPWLGGGALPPLSLKWPVTKGDREKSTVRLKPVLDPVTEFLRQLSFEIIKGLIPIIDLCTYLMDENLISLPNNCE